VLVLYWLVLFARIAKVGTCTELGNAEEVFDDGCRSDGPAKKGVTHGQMDGVEGQPPDAALMDGEIFKHHVT
jgi:hypothetical protein